MRRFVLAFWMLVASGTPASADDWPQWRGPRRDGVWRETGLIAKFASPQIKSRWRQPIGAGYSGPSVADGRVFVTDHLVRPRQVERVHCFDEQTGEKRWTHTYDCRYTISYDAGPRASVAVEEDRAYALGAMGHLHCLNVEQGDVVWQHDLNKRYLLSTSGRMPIWGIAASPLIFKDLVILSIGGRDGASIVAFDKKSGEVRWEALDDRAQYSAPLIVQQAGQEVLVCWTGDGVVGLDPASGKPHWREPLTPIKMPIGIATPIVSQDRLFVTSFYDGSLLLRLRQDELAVEKIWRRRGSSEHDTDALHSIISTPVFLGDHIYGVDSYGELRCLEAATGDRVWEDRTATPRARWSNIHFVRNGDRVWMFNERGELIIANLSPAGFQEISRAKLIEPTREQLRQRGGVCWAHPAFANRHIFIRNDKEILSASLAAD